MNAQIMTHTSAAQSLAQLIHRVIQHLPEADRNPSHQRAVSLMTKMPDAQASAEIMAILEPGFQAMQGRA